jgi:hypothetical protein
MPSILNYHGVLKDSNWDAALLFTYNAGHPSQVGPAILKRNTLIEVNFKGTNMKNRIVVMSSNGVMSSFDSESTAHSHIEKLLKKDSSLEFTLFKAYQEIKPKKIKLSELITNIS